MLNFLSCSISFWELFDDAVIDCRKNEEDDLWIDGLRKKLFLVMTMVRLCDDRRLKSYYLSSY